ncbi:MAG: membrane protein insertion efficiency factor YidD [Sphingomonadaceae bacterium]
MAVERPSVLVRLLAGLFRLWQLSFSVILPPSCRFSPSCSHYGIEALRRHGVLAGLWLTVRRISRCHPWGGSGHDPVPDTFSCRSSPSRPRSAPSDR